MATGTKTVTIIVEGTEHEWPKGDAISFEQIVELEFGNYDPNTTYSVFYTRGEGNKKGSLAPGGSVKVKEGMVFNVSPTGQS